MNWTRSAGLSFLCAVACAAQQKSDSIPSRAPDVFLDNHRPLIEKKGKPATTRTVSGQVVDDSGQQLEGALVTLTDSQTKESKKYFTKKDGRYSFDDLSFSVDYQLQARWKNLASDPRKLSQYDHAPKIVRILEITTPEGKAPPTVAKQDSSKPPR